MSGKRYKRTVTASEFVVTDDNNVVRCRIGMSPIQIPSISLSDEKGNERVELYLDKDDRPFICLSDGTAQARLMLTLGDQGDPRLWMYEGNNENARIGIMVDKNGSACVEVRSREADAGAFISVHADGCSSFNMWTEEGQAPTASIRLNTAGEAEISLYGSDEKKCWTVTNQKTT